ncbi:MAG: hypothetical protein DMG57_35105 [Acidobacteria bacterium]|nr:MAG: hypothetical protein DMG57_35105 [Acidobacteriota bacterium]
MRIKAGSTLCPLRLRSLFQRRQVEQELDEELQYHVERKTEQYTAQGFTPEEARHAALQDLDGLEQRKEECRGIRRVNLVRICCRICVTGFRTLTKDRGFSALVDKIALSSNTRWSWRKVSYLG